MNPARARGTSKSDKHAACVVVKSLKKTGQVGAEDGGLGHDWRETALQETPVRVLGSVN